MELSFINYTHKEKNLSFDIKSGTIYGITGNGKEEIVNLIALNHLNKGQLIIDEEKVTKETIHKYKKKISLVDINVSTHHESTLNIMKDYIIRNNLTIKDPIKKIKDSLKIVGLDENILDRNIKTLSLSEKKLFQVAMSLLSNPEIIILQEPFKCLDKQHEKELVMLLIRLKEQFQKTIVISTDDSNKLYQHTTQILLIKNDEIFLSGATSEVYMRVDYLKRNKFEIPDIVEFTYIAKKKKEVKIDYHKDIRDIIKDIYKHI